MTPTQDQASEQSKMLTQAQEIFKNAKPEYQTLIRYFLKEERDVMHLKRRSDILTRLYDYVKQVVK